MIIGVLSAIRFNKTEFCRRKGDSGGPVVAARNNYAYAAGILSGKTRRKRVRREWFITAAEDRI